MLAVAAALRRPKKGLNHNSHLFISAVWSYRVSELATSDTLTAKVALAEVTAVVRVVLEDVEVEEVLLDYTKKKQERDVTMMKNRIRHVQKGGRLDCFYYCKCR